MNNPTDKTRNGTEDNRTLQEAAAVGTQWLSSNPYRWDGTQYVVVANQDSLIPGVGYYLSANIECELLLLPNP